MGRRHVLRIVDCRRTRIVDCWFEHHNLVVRVDTEPDEVVLTVVG